MARGELHIQLAVNYADDEKFEEVSRSARLLYVDSLCSAKKLLNDGVFSRVKVRKLMYPERPSVADKAAAELVAAGLWNWDAQRKVFIIAAWLKRNKSRSQIEQDRKDAEEASLKANHTRWHVGRNEVDPKCRLCSKGGSGGGSGPGSGGGIRPESTETETETETEIKNKPPSPPASPVTNGRARAIATQEAPDGNPGPAEELVTAWINACNRRPSRHVINDVGQLVAEMLQDDVPAADIERGIQLWQARGSNPRTLPSFVNQVMNARPAAGNVLALPNRRPTTDQRVADALAIGAQLQADEDRKALPS
jgi:hypothetical protein